MSSLTCISWVGQWDLVWHVFEVAVHSQGCCLCFSLSRRVRCAGRLDAHFRECGLEAIVAFSVQLSWVLSAHNCHSNNAGISIEMEKNLHHLSGGKKSPNVSALFTLWLYVAKFPLIERLKKQPYVAFLCVANIKIFSPEAFEALGSGSSSGFFKGPECALLALLHSFSPAISVGDSCRHLGWLSPLGAMPGKKIPPRHHLKALI